MFKKIAEVLRKNGSLECMSKAQELEKDAFQSRSLDLRSLGLKSGDIVALSEILTAAKESKDISIDLIDSFSLSYNSEIGDIGATHLARSLPITLSQLGLVACGISDQGGVEILQWMKETTSLQMICIEQNPLSEKVTLEFQNFKKNNPNVVVVF